MNPWRPLLTAASLLLAACGSEGGIVKPRADDDGDGYAVDVDCDDAHATVNPDAPEVCDGLDNDCDGDIDGGAFDAATWYTDADQDGYGDADAPVLACERGDGFVADNTDCDDDDAAIHPDADEPDCADPTDYNCDGSVGYADADADGAPACEDCDDGDSAINPDAAEICDPADTDEDCDGLADDDDPSVTGGSTWHQDGDADGYGDPDSTVVRCDGNSTWISDATDCDDDDINSFPGAVETCGDGADQDCDGRDLACASPYVPSGTYSADELATRVEGVTSSASVGIWSVGVGDFNGDGQDDYLVPAVGTSNAGVVYLYYGPLEGAYFGDSTDADAVISGGASSDKAWAPFAIGDHNGDGIEDFAIGAYGYDQSTATSDAGGVFVLSGPVTGATTLSTSLPTFYMNKSSTYLGRIIHSAGDTNDDGYDDMMVNAPNYDSSAGALFLVEGSFVAGAQLITSVASTTWTGESTNNYAGQDFVSDIDLNNDGEEDLVISAYGYNSNQGRVYVYYGPFASGTITLGTATADAVIEGDPSGGGFFGHRLAVVPDMNGDGYDEVAIAAPYYNGAASYTGKVYVFNGPLSGTYADTDADLTVSGSSASDLCGFSVGGVEDIDGDGGGELMVGCYGYDTATVSSAGAVTLFYSESAGDLDASEADVFISGGVNDGFLGHYGGPAGDFDGDGVPDFYSCANGDVYADASLTTTGIVYFVPGNIDNALLNGADTELSYVKYTGWRVSTAGDFNHDGYDDIIASSSYSTGDVALFLGPLTSASSPSAAITGVASGDEYGQSIDGGGRVNTDSYDDFVVGAPFEDSNGTESGTVYLIAGRSTPSSYAASTGAYAQYWGASSEKLGYAVSLVSDWDGDGYDDMLMGAIGKSSGAGAAYIVSAPSPTHKGLVTSYADSTFSFSTSSSLFGSSVDGDGDIDGDGFADVLIAARGYDLVAADAGGAFVFLGGTHGSYTEADADATLLGEVAGDQVGYSSVGLLGDVDGDGYDDVAIGAPYADPNGASSGVAYLLLGPLAGTLDLGASDGKIEGLEANDNLGTSVDGAGDVNADGYADWLVGGHGSSRGFSGGGVTYLVYGPADGVETPMTYFGPHESSYVGAVAGAGDLNADGYDDYIFGAWGESAVWVYLGG